MTITSADIKLMASERMTDEDDGGGMQTAIEIVDGESNNLFPDISRLDRTYGRVNLREFYPSVQTDTTDTYYGAHCIITKPPADPNVSALMFVTGEEPAERTEARDKMENYVVKGSIAQMFLLNNQNAGSRTLTCFARPEQTLPEIGDVFFLIENEDDADEYYQSVKITSVDYEIVQRTDADGTFTRKLIYLGTLNALRYTFHGAEISRYDTLSPDAIVRESTIADAAKYYGAARLSADIDIGDLTLSLDSIYGQLVPSTRGEAAITDVQAGGTVSQTITSGGEAFDIAGPANTGVIDVEINNRAYNYVHQCAPIPAPGALTVEYRAMGKWYQLTMDNAGNLEGDGAGACNLDSGSVSVTLGALPDVGSKVVFTWTSKIAYTDRAGYVGITATPPRYELTLSDGARPHSVTISWLSGGVTVTATDDGAGNITGSATGRIAYASGKIYIQPAAVPDQSAEFVIDYDKGAPVIETVSAPTAVNNLISFQIPSQSAMTPGSVEIEFNGAINSATGVTAWNHQRVAADGTTEKHEDIPTSSAPQYTKSITLTGIDDGEGAIMAGTVDYLDGQFSLPLNLITVDANKPVWGIVA